MGSIFGSNKNNDLLEAAQNGYFSRMVSLLSQEANVNYSDQYGQTPLKLASAKGHKDLVELLLSQGANLNAADIEAPDIKENLFRFCGPVEG